MSGIGQYWEAGKRLTLGQGASQGKSGSEEALCGWDKHSAGLIVGIGRRISRF